MNTKWHIGNSRGKNANYIYAHGEIPELDACVCHVTGLPHNRTLREIEESAGDYDERLQCARLIAAAPDLLAALQTLLLAATADGWPSGWGMAKDKTFAAIAKAKGL